MDNEHLLASASGKGHRDIISKWIGSILVGVFIVFPLLLAISKTPVIVVFALIAAAICVVLAKEAINIGKSSINVYEDGIKGLRVVQTFLHPLAEFQLTYDKISSVEVVNNNTVFIATSANVKDRYKIYAKNAKEIREVIMSQKSVVMGNGKMLASANGKGNRAITTCWTVGLIALAVCIISVILAVNTYTSDQDSWGRFASGSEYYFSGLFILWLVIGVLSATLLIIATIPVIIRISRTIIDVYENNINGLGVVPQFPLASFRLSDFQLTYDKISSVDVVNGNAVIINATGVQHKIYAKNAIEIRDVLMSRKNAVSGA